MVELCEISLDGYQVVASDYFSNAPKEQPPILTFFDGKIRFSKQCVAVLNNCENILLQINTEERKVVISPTTSRDKDALHWLNKKTPTEARKVSCIKLTDKLFDTWNWNKDHSYRAKGKLVTSGNKVMLLFDFSTPDSWKRTKKKHAD